mmetsp:Transcript_12793/g.21637  ORF Transcript_12793/g.21637 Transcript_12793/m.21637 type:complete len:269 (+) Transcript_12793:397-1203(+)
MRMLPGESSKNDMNLSSPGSKKNYLDASVEKSRKRIIFTLCITNFIANSAYSSIAPFFPAEALLKGVPESTMGVIIAGYSISMVAFAPLLGVMLSKFGRKNVLIYGCLAESVAMFCFAMFIYVDNPLLYGILCFLCRVVEGFGNGCLNSATSSIICTNYPDNMGNLIGLTQTFTGLGMLSGPVIGSFLYEAGGFKLPFFVTSALLFIQIFPIMLFFKSDRKVRDQPAQSFLLESQENLIGDQEAVEQQPLGQVEVSGSQGTSAAPRRQ